MADFKKFLPISIKASELLIGLAFKSELWELVQSTTHENKKDSNIKVFKSRFEKIPDEYKKLDKLYDYTHGCPWNFTIYKSVGFIDIEIKTMLQFLRNPHHFLEWNKNCISYNVMELLEDNIDIAYASFGPTLHGDSVTSNDFVLIRRLEQIDDYYVDSLQSIECPEKPPVSGYSRGFMYPSGWLLRRNGNSTEVTYILCTDLKGAVSAKHIQEKATLTEVLSFLPSLECYVTKEKLSKGKEKTKCEFGKLQTEGYVKPEFPAGGEPRETDHK
jgi:hypothetical protein